MIPLQSYKQDKEDLQIDNSYHFKMAAASELAEVELYLTLRNVLTQTCSVVLQEVIIQQPLAANRKCRYYKIMDPATPLCLAACGHFYEEDEYDMYVLEHDGAPFGVSTTKGS